MEQVTQDLMSSVLSDEFKIAVEKKDKVLRGLDLEATKLQDTITARRKELDELDNKKAGLQDAIIMAYQDKEDYLKKEKDNFEQSKENSTKSIEDREKSLDKRECLHEQIVKSHFDTVSNFNKEKADFSNKKKAIVETLSESLKIHSSLLGDAIEALNDPYSEEVKDDVEKEEVKDEPATTVL